MAEWDAVHISLGISGGTVFGILKTGVQQQPKPETTVNASRVTNSKVRF